MEKYERYVRAVTFLLDWLLCAHEHLLHAVNVFQLKTLNDKGSSAKKKKENRSGKFSVDVSASTATDISSLMETLSLGVTTRSKLDNLVEISPAKTSATLVRLRDPDIPAELKVEDVQFACNVINQFREAAAQLSDPSRTSGTSVDLHKSVASESTQIINMMQKVYQVDHAAVKVPTLASVRGLCETTLAFATFVLDTAQLCMLIERKSQALEVLNVLEKRLVKGPLACREMSVFRKVMQMYSATRDFMGLGRAASSESLRKLEPYM
ncbi:hypothetical protein PC114_g23475 [Phytophthora cactorum]|nr:hypothetical protein PC114_g23475 [Phytophthora cactorum]